MHGIIEMVRKIEQIDAKLIEWYILMDSYQDEIHKLDITVGREKLAIFGYEKGKKEVYQKVVSDLHSRIVGMSEERANLRQTLLFSIPKEMRKFEDMYSNIDAMPNSELTEMLKKELEEKIILITNLADFAIEDIGEKIDNARNERIEKLKQE